MIFPTILSCSVSVAILLEMIFASENLSGPGPIHPRVLRYNWNMLHVPRVWLGVFALYRAPQLDDGSTATVS